MERGTVMETPHRCLRGDNIRINARMDARRRRRAEVDQVELRETEGETTGKSRKC